jgi:flagellar biosynthesis regulator FlaF
VIKQGDTQMNMMSSMISKELTVFEEDALALTQAALEISRAFESKDERRLAGALDRNLKLWVGIRTLVSQADNPLPMPIKDNLIRLSSFVAQKTFEMQNGPNAKSIEALTNTNLQISEGLLDKRTSH